MLERAVELDPEFVLPWAQLVSIHGILYAYYDPTADRLEQSQRALDRALALAPRHSAVRLAEGYYHYYGLTDYEGALEIFEAVEKDRPNDSEVQQSIAWINRRLGRFDAALDRLHQALAIDPQNAHVNFHIGVTSAALRRFAEADPYFDRAIALAPDTLDMYETKAETLVRWTGETAAARAVLARGPGNEESLDTWVRFDLQDRDFRGALARLDAVGLHTTDPPDPRPLLHLLRGVSHTALGEAGLARQSYEAARVTAEAILEDAPSPFVRGLLAHALAGLGRKEEAIEQARVAFEEVATDRFGGVRLRESQAAVFVGVGEEDKAIDLLAELLATPYQDAITVPILQSQPRWDPLRDHPRFQELIRESS
jgi:serine/threonine-protein kinase